MTAVLPAAGRRRSAPARIVGIDLARAIAMLGMVIAHYAWPDGSDGALDTVATAVGGRAMPLFVLLGGLGATILSGRSTDPDRTLLIRAAILYPAGLILQEATTFIAIILQSYGLFFALTPLLRRLSSRTLAVLAAAIGLAGGWTHQVIGPGLDHFDGPADLIDNPAAALWSLLFNGVYPFFPVASFFILGLLLGRLDLGSVTVQRRLAVGGAGVGLLTLSIADRLLAGSPKPGPATGDGSFEWTRLLDTTGHSEMPAWVISAAGTSVAVLGLCLLVGPRLGTTIRPLVALGQLALSFYVFQAVLVRFTPHPETTPLGQEFITALAIYIGFAAFALGWRSRFRHGPLEAALRLASAPRRGRTPLRPVG